ncbi:MAG: exodeoxyribonuclease VII small subunit [Ignavibacteriales bacterium]|nr:exodeoxyribonuclease VII small subunit [Ignavibacteriales bacterium]
MKKNNVKSFEDSLKRLEEISNLLDSEEVGLDQAISLYEEGIELSKICMNKLKEAELKISSFKKNLEDNTIEETEFEE